mmetsp:Transcript_4468/g.12524  ORF Transcript_4468/g.12524 Transcript_4468/m.12524 type:complete len:224 (+) Transcript_4468:163-834(+)
MWKALATRELVFSTSFMAFSFFVFSTRRLFSALNISSSSMSALARSRIKLCASCCCLSILALFFLSRTSSFLLWWYFASSCAHWSTWNGLLDSFSVHRCTRSSWAARTASLSDRSSSFMVLRDRSRCTKLCASSFARPSFARALWPSLRISLLFSSSDMSFGKDADMAWPTGAPEKHRAPNSADENGSYEPRRGLCARALGRPRPLPQPLPPPRRRKGPRCRA